MSGLLICSSFIFSDDFALFLPFFLGLVAVPALRFVAVPALGFFTGVSFAVAAVPALGFFTGISFAAALFLLLDWLEGSQCPWLEVSLFVPVET